MTAISPRWLLAAGPAGLLAVGPKRVVEVEIDALRQALVDVVDALASGAAAATEQMAAAGIGTSELDELRAALTQAGALQEAGSTEDDDDPAGAGPAPLAAVLEAALEGSAPRSCYTSEELLLIPAACEPKLARRALRAFVAGLRPVARAVAYGHVATYGDGARGDRPHAGRLQAARGLDPAAIHVVDLDGSPVVSIAPEDLALLGADRPHRLGIVQQLVAIAPRPLPGGSLHVARARYAPANLRFARDAFAHGVALDPEHAALVARAEAAERHAIGRTSGVVMRRARASQLDAGALQTACFAAPNERQAAQLPPSGEDDERLWVRARTLSSEPRWIPAGAVLSPFVDTVSPEPWLLASSSGVAAHLTTGEAADRALRELVERDALMWRWVQRVAPARLSEAPLAEATRDRLRALRRERWDVRLLDLTLDMLPVVLCAMRRDGALALGMSCRRDPLDAASRALEECLMIAYADADNELTPLAEPERVQSPSDHLRLHHHPRHATAHAFLLDAEQEVDPREIPAPDDPLAELVAHVGEPLLVEHAVPDVRPFAVVRALIPGLIPISFGYDREPLGLARLAAPIRTRDGRTLGRQVDLTLAGPILPHPFP